MFFCLYAHHWDDPVQCNSNHSRLLGFFSTLPSIWRALQCIRRYADTKNIFPHLVNCGKYGATIMSYMTLSLYRINGSTTNLALFITFSIINSIYTSVWDLLMDFSLLQPDARYPFLRDILALKRRWPYYTIMAVDPMLRSTWIFYAIFTHNTQHSTFVSFLISLGEVTRRGMWALFRVENEHCANVAQYKASRDVPLPYHLEPEPLVEPLSSDPSPSPAQKRRPEVAATTAIDHGPSPPAPEAPRTPRAEEGGLRRRPLGRIDSMAAAVSGGTTSGAIRKIMAEAHKQDFEKRRRPRPEDVVKAAGDDDGDEGLMSDDAEDDDDDDSASVLNDERMEARNAEGLVRGDDDDDEEHHEA